MITFLSPHNIAYTDALVEHNSVEACRNILDLIQGNVPSNIVNPEVLLKPSFQRKLKRLADHGNYRLPGTLHIEDLPIT